jgi:hypothetical protein
VYFSYVLSLLPTPNDASLGQHTETALQKGGAEEKKDLH